MKTFEEILTDEKYQPDKVIQGEEKYLAHLRGDNRETLSAHSTRTLDYFMVLIRYNSLELNLNNLISQIVLKNFNHLDPKIVDFIKELFVGTIFFHDFGKLNENFQIRKMNNCNNNFATINNGISSEHSILSSYLYLSHFLKAIFDSSFSEKYKDYLYTLTHALAHNITKHHGTISDALDYHTNDDLLAVLENYYQKIKILEFLELDIFKNLLEYKQEYKDIISISKSEFELFLLLKLNSSLLTASDYYATNEFMTEYKCNDFGIMNKELKSKINHNTYSIPYNSELQNNFNYYKSLRTVSLTQLSEKNINLLRQKLSAEVVSRIRENINSKLFYIEAPTGSGKTNLSLLALTELLKQRDDITKVFYVFPFTTLITQTIKFFREYLALDYTEIAELHSKASFNKKNDDNNENDAEYGCKRKNYIDNLFVNYPISLISHIKFFNILTSNEKEANYLLHRLANSVVIIDELQSYNPTQWDKVNYVINKYSESLNITFIIMSATLPKISKLFLDEKGLSKDNFIYLVKNKQEYYLNPNFKDRVKFDFTYLEKNLSIEQIPEIVQRHSEKYYSGHKSVKSIIEFVTKLSAHKFYEKIIEKSLFCDYEKYIITGTILEPRRKEIINYLKSTESEHKKILVICTQVIEAGLDIDMDIGFRDKGIIDSEEQFAGRINRNASKNEAELFVLNLNDAGKVFKSDLRYKQKIDMETYKSVLSEKNFDLLYNKVFETIKKDNENPYLAENLTDFISQIKSLRFREIKEQFQLIKDNTLSVFVPCDIDKQHFTSDEINFLFTFEPEICKQDTIDGDIVWNIYESIIMNKEKSFDKKIDLKIISSILSKFTFNIWNNYNTINLLRHYSEDEIKYGFIKLLKHEYEKIYSYKTGLKTDLETDCNFL